jgi:SAM-dependent methyltransferase
MERTRLLWLVLAKFDVFRPGLRIMHLAPEMPLAKRFSELSGERYYACDADAARYKSRYTFIRPLDLCCDLVKLPSCSFDVIIHSHVLEHVRCDVSEVLREFERILAPGGQHFLSVPVSGDVTREDLSDDLTPEQRLKLFGQADHYRIFGQKSLPEMLDAVWGQQERHHIEPLELFEAPELERAAIPKEAWTGISSHSIFRHERPRSRRIRVRAEDAMPGTASIADSTLQAKSANPDTPIEERRPQLVLHIGMPKAGTTSIQRWLTANRAAALKGGLDYWSIAENHSEPMFLAFVDPERVAKGTMWFQRDALPSATEPGRLKASFNQFLKGLGGKTGFVSAEVLWTLAPADVKTLAKFLRARDIDTRILCLIRPPAEFMRSAAQQRCRTSLAIGELGMGFRNKVAIQYRRLDAWVEHFGRENVVLEEYGDNVVGQLREVLKRFNIPVELPASDERTLNPSISLLAAKALLALNQSQNQSPAGTGDSARQLRAILKDIQDAEFLLPDSVLQRMRPVFEKESEYLAERFSMDREWLLADSVGIDDALFFQWDFAEVVKLLEAINAAIVSHDRKNEPGRSGGGAGA